MGFGVSFSNWSSTESTSTFCPDDPKGPMKRDRSCTDLGFFIFLALFTSFLIISTIVAGTKSDPRRLIYGYDDYGNLCGIKNQPIEGVKRSGVDYTSERYVTLAMKCSSDNCDFIKTCTEECPENYKEWPARRCINQDDIGGNGLTLQYYLLGLKQAGSDISTCWKEILFSCLISIALSATLVLIFRCCGAIIVYAVLAFTAITLLVATIFTWVMYSQKTTNYDDDAKDAQNRNEANSWIAVAIPCTVFLIAYPIVLAFMHKKIKFVVVLFEEAGKYIADVPLLMVQSILTSAAIALTLFFLILTFIWVQTTGELHVDHRGTVTFPVNTFFVVVGWSSLFGGIWLVTFILACQHVIVAGAIGNCYFTRDKTALYATGNTIFISWKNLVCNHLGSTALGSFIIAVLNFIRAILNGMRRKNSWVASLLICLFGGMIEFLTFLFRNVYIMIAIFGEPFCTSARRAYAMFTNNVMSVMAVGTIGDLVFFVGNVGITILVGLISFALVRSIDGVNYVWLPVTISCCFAFLNSHCCLSLYRVTMDTLMICFWEDCQMNDGVDKPYFMNSRLKMFLENNMEMETTKEQPV